MPLVLEKPRQDEVLYGLRGPTLLECVGEVIAALGLTVAHYWMALRRR